MILCIVKLNCQVPKGGGGDFVIVTGALDWSNIICSNSNMYLKCCAVNSHSTALSSVSSQYDSSEDTSLF